MLAKQDQLNQLNQLKIQKMEQLVSQFSHGQPFQQPQNIESIKPTPFFTPIQNKGMNLDIGGDNVLTKTLPNFEEVPQNSEIDFLSYSQTQNLGQLNNDNSLEKYQELEQKNIGSGLGNTMVTPEVSKNEFGDDAYRGNSTMAKDQ